MGRYYCNAFDPPLGRVQNEDVRELPMSILEMAHEEYKSQGHGQSLDRIIDRGGFGSEEVIRLLADRIVRLSECR